MNCNWQIIKCHAKVDVNKDFCYNIFIERFIFVPIVAMRKR